MRAIHRKYPNIRLWIEYVLVLLVIVFGSFAVSVAAAVGERHPEMTFYEKVVFLLPMCKGPP